MTFRERSYRYFNIIFAANLSRFTIAETVFLLRPRSLAIQR
ncbi:hypothetical protein SAMN05518668_106246 [Sphingobium sp. YR657]|uniref:Uncharacterized protein n=1 Tax=Sphingobium yanoikuyae ATCC 51230 TaxID=883163 RepID=K9DB47_SPHYA|nr:hypothetical protein HMPREF9718_02288 [Sphingobium yanoikuyae ATCC 51230]SHM17854.1 hypothetical protein SAMN05518668_106246 [Sphingobium sp. YR657]